MRAIKLINTYYCSSHWLVPCLSIKVGNMTMADEKIQNHNKTEMNLEWNGKLRNNQIEIKLSVKEMANISWLKAICYSCSVHSVHFTKNHWLNCVYFEGWINCCCSSKKKQKKTINEIISFKCVDDVLAIGTRTLLLPRRQQI